MSYAITDTTKDFRYKAVSQMRAAVLDLHTVPMYYVGGTLCIDLDSTTLVAVNLTDPELTDNEKLYAAQLYLTHKSESHSYYELAKQIVDKEQ